MITAIFNYSNGAVASFEMTEHAHSAEPGEDLICAGVSAVVFGLTNAIIGLDESELQIQMEDGGYIKVENIPQTDKAQILIYGMITSLRTIEEEGEHFKYLTVIEEQV